MYKKVNYYLISSSENWLKNQSFLIFQIDNSAILLENNNVLAFCHYMSSHDGTADFACVNYKDDREGIIKLEKEKPKMGFCGLFRKKEKKTSSALQVT